MNIFERATREQFRYNSVVGPLTTEQLWQLPLISSNSNKASLNSVAIAVNTELKTVSEESFVSETSNPRAVTLEAMLDVVKYVIEVRKTEAAATKRRKEANEERTKLLDALHRRKDEALNQLTEEEILARLSAIEN